MLKIKQITRIRYQKVKNEWVSHAFFIDGLLHWVSIKNNTVKVVGLKHPTTNKENVKFVHEAKSLRAAKVAARRWLVKHGASILEEIRKVL